MGLREDFRDPPAEFRQAPFWFWNHRLDKETLGWQIEEMYEKGLGGFVMHARHGLITPYLSDEWFECIRFCCAKARELGMVAWAYDERDWPSGPAGGAVIADPANRLSYLHLVEEEVEGPRTLSFGDEVVCAYGPKGRIQGPTWEAPEGKCRILKAVRFECPAILWFESYLDTLNDRACREFIRSTYDFHEQKLGDLRKLGLAGFFTDEPALSTYPDDLGRIPWTPSLPRAFQDIKGYDLLERLPELFSTEESGAQIRYDYWDVAAMLFERSFFAAIEAWCDERGLKLIGHALGEEPLLFQFRCLGNIFYLLKHLHMPGLDHLTCHVGKGNAGGMSPKMVASAALLAGRERTMTETFGESGWGLSLREMKWMSDWQIAHGINYFIPHAFYYSVEGRRKKDSPPSEFFQAPFWPYYRRFADYTARLTAAMTGGEHVAKIAVLYPMSSVWADFVPGRKGPGCLPTEVPEAVQAMDKAFVALGESLLAIHRDFVVVDEESFANAQVGEDIFAINGLEFEAAVVPKCTSIREDALAALKRVGKACPVVAVEAGPARVLRTRGPRAAAPVDLGGIPGVRVIAGAGCDDLAAALADVPPDVAMDDAPDVYYLHRRKEGKDLYFFANTARDPVDMTVSLETAGHAETWDPETGESSPAPGQRVENGRLQIPLGLPAMGSRLVVVDPARTVTNAPLVPFKAGPRIKLCALWHFNPENGNFLRLNRWDMTAQTRGHVTELRYSTEYVLPEHIANMRLILDGVPAKAYNVHEAARPIVAHETDAVVRLDGQPLTEELPWEIDPKFRVLDIKDGSEPGTHQIEIAIKNNGWFPQPALAEYAWLAGDFAVDATGGQVRLVPVRGIKAGPWESQGFPYFSGTGAYYADLELDQDTLGKRVFLEAGKVGDLLEVEVNGAVVGVRPWPPYRLEVSDQICAGPNLFVLRVTNSARNFFEGPDKQHPSGLLDDACLEVQGT